MAHVRLHEKLLVWQKAYELSLKIYKITGNYPDHERFGLMSQMRRASTSVPINIAEGNARRTTRDRRHFFTIAHASLEELHCECRISRDLGFVSGDDFVEVDVLINTISYLLARLVACQ